MPLRVTVVWNGTLRVGLTDQSGLSRRLWLGVQKVYSRDVAKVRFTDAWANALHTLQPGDKLVVHGFDLAQPGADAEDPDVSRLPPGETYYLVRSAKVEVFRGPRHTVIDDDVISGLSDTLPAWLFHLPSRPVHGKYRYTEFLSTLRGDIETNKYVVFWENAKPGPFELRVADRIGINAIVMDKSFNHLPCTEWSGVSQMADFSLQLAVHGAALVGSAVARLPFLCAGSVVRVHRARVYYRPPKYINLLLTRWASLMVFFYDDADSESPELGGRVCVSSITESENPTLTEDDEERARRLLDWIRERLTRESMSSYANTIREFLELPCSRCATFNDLFVQVVSVEVAAEVIVVDDGSSEELLRVFAGLPMDAAGWLFAHVARGHWLRLRDAWREPTGIVKVHPGRVTRVPAWCKDVADRRRELQHRRTRRSQNAAQNQALLGGNGSSGARDVPIEPAGAVASATKTEVEEGDGQHTARVEAQRSPTSSRPTQARATASQPGVVPTTEANTANAPVVGEEQFSAAVAEATATEEAHAELTPTALPPKEEATPEGRAAAAHCSTAACSDRPKAARLVAFPTGRPAVQLAGLAADSTRDHVLTDFDVGGIVNAFGSAASHVADLVCTHCTACGSNFAWDIVGADVISAKRRRRELPCGHFTFRLEFRGSLHLRDKDEFVEVFFADANELFGVRPLDVVSDEAASSQAQRCLDGLLSARESSPGTRHSAGVFWVQEFGDAGSYVLCNTRIEVS